MRKTKETQYQEQLEMKQKGGPTPLGITASYSWATDPKHFLFVLARYKFVAKMLKGKGRVVEVGCGDAFGARLVLQEVGSLLVTDFDPVFIDDVRERYSHRWPLQAKAHDILEGPLDDVFEAAYSLDVIEHIPAKDVQRYMVNVCGSLTEHGEFIVGTPSLSSQAYASENSRRGHVNCMDADDLGSIMRDHFHHVFSFSMNDEVLHTGYAPMSHYLWAIGAGKKSLR